MSDKTNYGQSLTHMIKGNLGAGILSMPRSFANLGLVSGMLALPLLCLISGYCVHILVKSSRHVSKRLNDEQQLNYSILARRSFELGPSWLTGSSHTIGRLVDTALLVTQIGVCCVYIVFVVDNVTSIMASYHIHVSQSITFLAIFPITLMLSFIRTLSRLAIASLLANLIQALGLILIVEYLLRDMKHDTLRHDNFRPLNEMALGFGSVMFAFEGISVVLPVYNRIEKRKQFGSLCGVINVSFLVILTLYIIVGLLGYLRYGPHVKDSITLNLPAEPLYDAVRAMFTVSILLTYPLQFYVPNEIIWEWSKRNILSPPSLEVALGSGHDDHDPMKTCAVASVQGGKEALGAIIQNFEIHVGPRPRGGGGAQVDEKPQVEKFKLPSLGTVDEKKINNKGLGGNLSTPKVLVANISEKYTPKSMVDSLQNPATMKSVPLGNNNFGSKIDLINNIESGSTTSLDCGRGIVNSGSSGDYGAGDTIPVKYEYLCRILVVVLTFMLAYSVPKLNLLMDLIGSFSGVLLCLVIPSLIHMASYWEKLKGFKKGIMITVDSAIVLLGLAAGMGGSFSSLNQIIKGGH